MHSLEGRVLVEFWGGAGGEGTNGFFGALDVVHANDGEGRKDAGSVEGCFCGSGHGTVSGGSEVQFFDDVTG